MQTVSSRTGRGVRQAQYASQTQILSSAPCRRPIARKSVSTAATVTPSAPSPSNSSVGNGASVDWHLQKLKHVVDSGQFNRAAVDVVFEEAMKMERIRPGSPESRVLEGYIMSTLFYEPSTRTRLSFESAMSRLGGTVLSTESAGEYSSAAKGETLEGEYTNATACPTLTLGPTTRAGPGVALWQHKGTASSPFCCYKCKR